MKDSSQAAPPPNAHSWAAYGYFPAFRGTKTGSASAGIAALLGECSLRELDYNALNVFFRIGTFIGTDTPFREVKVDPPDYAWATSRALVCASRDTVIDQYIHLFRQAMARCISPAQDTSIGLSGGRDSRHILLELCSTGRAPQYCWTVDTPHKPDEAAVAAQLCKRLG